MKRSSFGLRVRVSPVVNLGERFIRVNPTDVEFKPHWDPKTASGVNALRSFWIRRRRITQPSWPRVGSPGARSPVPRARLRQGPPARKKVYGRVLNIVRSIYGIYCIIYIYI